MKKSAIWFVLIISILLQNCKSRETEKILFIGNSLTYFYDMPQTIQKMLNEKDTTIRIFQSTIPGGTLDAQLNEIITVDKNNPNNVTGRTKNKGEQTNLEKMLMKENWDRIIIQEEPAHILLDTIQQFQTNKLLEEIKKLNKNKECKYYLYEPILITGKLPNKICFSGYEISEKLVSNNLYCSKEYNSKGEFDSLADFQFQKLSTKNTLFLCDMNKNSKNIIAEEPIMKLVDETGHPTELGAYANACKFYKILTNRDLEEVKYIGNLSIEQANRIKKIVNRNN